jgi:hypothetical protein
MRRILCLVFVALYVSTAPAQETISLAVPVTTPSAVTVKFERLTFDLPAQTVSVSWIIVDGAGVTRFAASAYYTTPAPPDHPSQPTGLVLLNTLNTANMSTTSLIKRAFQRLQADNYIAAGAINGTPSH